MDSRHTKAVTCQYFQQALQFFYLLTKGDDADSLEDTTVDEQRFRNVTLLLGWKLGALRDDRDEDHKHTDEGECRGLCKLDGVSFDARRRSSTHFGYVSVETKWVANTKYAHYDDGASVGQEP